MFGKKRIKIDSDVTIWIKKLSVLDFSGCDYVPLIFSYVEPDPRHKTGVKDIENHQSNVSEVLEKAIVKIKSKRVNKKEFIDICLKNNTILEMIYTYIYTWTFKKKIVHQLVTANL